MGMAKRDRCIGMAFGIWHSESRIPLEETAILRIIINVNERFFVGALFVLRV